MDGTIEYHEKTTKQRVIDRELERLYVERGTISPRMLVEVAADRGNPLHGFFEWNDSEAAKRYRLIQAQQMILASKQIVAMKRDRKAKASQPIKPVAVRKYLSPGPNEDRKIRAEGLDDATFREAVIERHVERLRSWCRETIDIKELNPIRDSILKHIGALG